MRRFAITVGLSITFGAGLVATTVRPASAGYNVGVKYVHLDSAPAYCPPEGSALPSGFGGAITCTGLPTNTIYVRQTETDDGFRFTGFGGEGVSSTTVPIGLELEAGCRSGYRIHEAHLSEGESWDEGMGIVPMEAFNWSHSIDVDATKSFSTRIEADADIDYIERRPTASTTAGSSSAQHPTSPRAARASSSGPFRKGPRRRPHGCRPGATSCSSSTTRRSPAAGPGCSTGSGT